MRKNQKLGAGPEHVRRENIRGILELMRGEQAFSKVDLSRKSGLSTTTMTKLFTQLEATGLIEQHHVSRGSMGRPRTLYRLSTESACVLAAVIDIDTVSLASAGLSGETNVENSFPTRKPSTGFFEKLAEGLQELRKADGRRPLGISISAPGLIDKHTGEVVLSPNLHWLEGSRPAKAMADRLKIQTNIIHEEAALSLAQRTDPKLDPENFILLDFSAGVGAGVVCNGRPLTGCSGFAGEIGHITIAPSGKLCGCGNRGCLETVASDRAFLQAIPGKLTMAKALERLAEGKSAAVKAAELTMEYQAIGVAAALNIFNPGTIYIHSALVTVPDYIDRMREMTARRALEPTAACCDIRPAREGKIRGTVLDALNDVFDRNL